MQYKTTATLFFAATALAAPATDSTSDDYFDLYDTSSDDTFDIGDVPTSILTVLATAIPDSWYSDIMDPSSRDSIISAAAAGTYPAWYNSLPSSVKAWATSDFENQTPGASSTVDSSATQTETVGSSAVETGSSSSGAAARASTTATQTSSNAAETSSFPTLDSSSDSSPSSTSSSPSSSQSTGGAPAPTGGVAMGVTGAVGVLALAIAL